MVQYLVPYYFYNKCDIDAILSNKFYESRPVAWQSILGYNNYPSIMFWISLKQAWSSVFFHRQDKKEWEHFATHLH